MHKILTPLLILMLAIGCAPANANDFVVQASSSQAFDEEILRQAKEQEQQFLIENATSHWIVARSNKKPKGHGICYKLTHLGLTHKAAKVAGSPFYVAGFTAACVGGLVGIPFTKAIQDFESKPFVSF